MANPSEESIARVVECLFNHPRHRELLYKALVHCQTERTEHAAEEFLARQPEAAQALQTPYTLLRNLAAAGGVTVIAHDAQGLALDETRCEQLRAEGLDDDALADLVAERRVLTTPAGCAACELLAPEHRTLAAIYKVPERRATFVRLLDFCRTPRKLADINQLLADDPALAPSQRTAGQSCTPVTSSTAWKKQAAWCGTDLGSLPMRGSAPLHRSDRLALFRQPIKTS